MIYGQAIQSNRAEKSSFPKVRLGYVIESRDTPSLMDAWLCPYRMGERVRH